MPNKRKMTLYQAWRFLEKKWQRPTDHEERSVYSVNLSRTSLGSCGLCPCVEDLKGEGLITWQTYLRMRKAIERLPRPSHSIFVWSTDREGARQRMLFCKQQAEKILNKRRTKRGKLCRISPR